MNTLIRKVRETDFDQVYPLFGQLWPSKELDRESLQAVFNRGIHSETDELFCIEYSGKLVGFCAYAVVNNLWQAGFISFMYAMVVDENFRGKGLGTLLIEAVINDSKTKGMKRIELDSSFHREKAHQFYQKLGFEKRAFLFSYPL